MFPISYHSTISFFIKHSQRATNLGAVSFADDRCTNRLTNDWEEGSGSLIAKMASIRLNSRDLIPSLLKTIVKLRLVPLTNLLFRMYQKLFAL